MSLKFQSFKNASLSLIKMQLYLKTQIHLLSSDFREQKNKIKDKSQINEERRKELEKKKLEQKQENIDTKESEAEEVNTEENRRKEVAEKASKANRFEAYSDAVVAVKKTYFYSMPDEKTKKGFSNLP